MLIVCRYVLIAFTAFSIISILFISHTLGEKALYLIVVVINYFGIKEASRKIKLADKYGKDE